MVSTDKYTKTYQVNGSTSVNAGNGGLSTVKVGDQVSITATVHGSTATISSIIDLSRLGNGAFGPGGGSQGQPRAEGADVWARPGLPRDRAGTRHQGIRPRPAHCRQAGGESGACGLRWLPDPGARPSCRNSRRMAAATPRPPW